jgi:hypothetical protein
MERSELEVVKDKIVEVVKDKIVEVEARTCMSLLYYF